MQFSGVYYIEKYGCVDVAVSDVVLMNLQLASAFVLQGRAYYSAKSSCFILYLFYNSGSSSFVFSNHVLLLIEYVRRGYWILMLSRRFVSYQSIRHIDVLQCGFRRACISCKQRMPAPVADTNIIDASKTFRKTINQSITDPSLLINFKARTKP